MPRKSRQVDAAETQYPIKVTAHQREALISCTQLKGKIKDRLKDATESSKSLVRESGN